MQEEKSEKKVSYREGKMNYNSFLTLSPWFISWEEIGWYIYCLFSHVSSNVRILIDISNNKTVKYIYFAELIKVR